MRGIRQQRRDKYSWTSSVGENAVQSGNIFTSDNLLGLVQCISGSKIYHVSQTARRLWLD